jgi:hypothetical protein
MRWTELEVRRCSVGQLARGNIRAQGLGRTCCWEPGLVLERSFGRVLERSSGLVLERSSGLELVLRSSGIEPESETVAERELGAGLGTSARLP